MSDAPTIYLLHGDDEFGIKDFVHAMQEKLGDPATAEMNTSMLEGRVSLGELKNAVSAMPFLASRRLVVLTGGTRHLRSKDGREKFVELLEHIPASTALALIEYSELKRSSWLMKWAGTQGGRVFQRVFALPKGGAMIPWIMEYANKQGGQVNRDAAVHLAGLLTDDTRMVATEVDKLLTYVNFSRPVDVDDVELLTASVPQGNVFDMVDAIGNKQGQKALEVLHNLLAEQDALPLLGMVVRQFRLLLLYKDMQQKSATIQEISRALRTPEFVVRKLSGQARNFEPGTLEAIYRRLVEIDERIKTGKVQPDVALDTLIVGLTSG